MPNTDKRPLKVFLCHARLTQDGVCRYAWLDKEKLLSGQDWGLEIRKAVRESIICSQEKAGNL